MVRISKRNKIYPPLLTYVASSGGDLQMTINVGIGESGNISIQWSNNALLEGTVADLFHCVNLPDWEDESLSLAQSSPLGTRQDWKKFKGRWKNDKERLQTKFTWAEEELIVKVKVCATKIIKDSRSHITLRLGQMGCKIRGNMAHKFFGSLMMQYQPTQQPN